MTLVEHSTCVQPSCNPHYVTSLPNWSGSEKCFIWLVLCGLLQCHNILEHFLIEFHMFRNLSLLLQCWLLCHLSMHGLPGTGLCLVWPVGSIHWWAALCILALSGVQRSVCEWYCLVCSVHWAVCRVQLAVLKKDYFSFKFKCKIISVK